jgi:hypothetical protein
MDSKHYKLSNGILFVIFQVVVWKIWISKDLTEIWFKFLFWIGSEPERATRHFITRWYRFVGIKNVGRRILSGLDVQDEPVPIHLSESVWAVGLGSDEQEKREGDLTG